MATHLILRGFNPDPSIIRVGDDYYIATSTFEWWPGVQIFHSRDLKTWRLVARPLNRVDLLDLRGVPDSCGVWAPCLSFADGRFWLAYTVVTRFDGSFKDTHNYLTTCETIDGEWSSPTYLNASGFDPSLFHDEDGRKWLVNMVWSHAPGRSPFDGIVLQEYSVSAGALIGAPRKIFSGTALGYTEGPHLYRRDGWLYLVTAEGGTGYGHAVTVARSRNLLGPYEVDPAGPVIKAGADDALQRCGHASLVETPSGDLYMAHLCSRPMPGVQRSPMGRESALTQVVPTSDGWIRAMDPGAEAAIAPIRLERLYVFEGSSLDTDLQWLRTPEMAEVFSLTERPGRLRLRGRDSLGSAFTQALVGVRQTEFDYEAETELEFEPESFQQMAGLAAYYNAHKHHYVYVSSDEVLGKHVGVMSCEGDLSLNSTFPLHVGVPVPPGPIRLRIKVAAGRLRFSWAVAQGDWIDLGLDLDATLLSDEAGKGEGANFTGTFIVLCAQDLSGRRRPADFGYLRYRTL